MSDREDIIQCLLATRGQSEGVTADAILSMQAAHTVGEIEPVATINGSNCLSLDDANRLMRLPAGTKLYTHPAPATKVPEPIEDESSMRRIGELGNMIHNFSCENQNNDYLCYRLAALAGQAWDIAGTASPTANPDAMHKPEYSRTSETTVPSEISDRSSTMQKAAQLAMGTRLNGLYEICEKQKTLSTAKLESYLNALHEAMRLDAIHLRDLAGRIDS